MPRFVQRAEDYTPVVDVELQPLSESYGEPQLGFDRPHRSWLTLFYLGLCVVAACCLTLGFIGGEYFQGGRSDSVTSFTKCQNPSIRHEWRSLSKYEKNEYIQAVQCLSNTSSRLGINQTLYDDFPFVHSRSGEESHDTAAFLSWHRYFIHIYEKALREQCAYTGHLSYWDWSLDWINITQSPVWDTEYGFGGNGDEEAGESIHGHCVTDGPFAGFKVPFVEKIPYPHCLSRGFATGDNLTQFTIAISPTALDELLRTPYYANFNQGVENGPHLSIPHSIRGDFATVTAPADPVFFLHHTQLDRLWWEWQQFDPKKRLKDYSGKAAYTSTLAEASLKDPIPMGGLAPDRYVEDIMSTESEILCYRY